MSVHPVLRANRDELSLENKEITPTLTSAVPCSPSEHSSDRCGLTPKAHCLSHSWFNHVLAIFLKKHLKTIISVAPGFCFYPSLWLAVLISGSPWPEFSQRRRGDDFLEASAWGRAWGRQRHQTPKKH